VSPLIERFSLLAPHYDLVLCDVWGVLHNGLAAFAESNDALTRYRAGGGWVTLVSNAPRPGASVIPLLDQLGVARSAYHDIITSGDVARAEVAARRGQSVLHIGPQRDAPIFAGLDVRFAPAESADYVLCSGLYDDERETAEDYRALLAGILARGLPMLCANPDLVVERGERLVYCAGAIADLYAALGGEVIYAGKPHRPIYDQALAKVALARKKAVPSDRILAIGDSVRTDLAGAAALGIDGIFVTAGIHAEELGGRDEPDPALLEQIFAAAGVRPRAVMRRLAW
jgi:HAD superfamily hydrolase (TIGR01459 family)